MALVISTLLVGCSGNDGGTSPGAATTETSAVSDSVAQQESTAADGKLYLLGATHRLSPD